MPTIFDYVNSKEIATYIKQDPTISKPMLGETLFPSKKTMGLDLSWIKGSKGLSVALKPSNYDAKATLRDRVGFSKIETEMPFFREAMRIGEKDRQELNKFVNATNIEPIRPILANIYDDVGQLVNGARVQTERMRMQLLSTGKISIVANRINYEYDYKHPSDHKETLVSGALWSDTANSRPLEDIRRWQDTVEENTGTRPTQLIMSRKTFNYLLRNESLKGYINPLANPTQVLITENQLKQFISANLGLDGIAVYNKKYALEGGAKKQYFPDDVVALIPNGRLGTTWYGTTPEESDLMSGNTDAKVNIVNTGIAVTTIKEPHPVNVMTVVSGIFLPSFENIDDTFIATVG